MCPLFLKWLDYNGTGGSKDGKCEVSGDENDIECVWQLIYERLKKLNKLDNLLKVREAKDWRTSTNAGQRKVKFEEAML
ncbi:MAG: methylenetetrahydrofolate reductase C-terminal domain-containing protein [Planctomycetota bacterium]|jgi:hypothetical protein